MPQGHTPSSPTAYIGTPTRPWDFMLPGLSEATPSTTLAAYSASELTELPASTVSTGIALIPAKGLSQMLMEFWSSAADNATASVPIFALRAVTARTSDEFVPPYTLGNVWRPQALLNPTCTVGANTVGLSTSGPSSTGAAVDARWIDDITIASLDFTSNPPGAQVMPAPTTQAGVTRTLRFDFTGAEYIVVFLPSGWNGHYAGI